MHARFAFSKLRKLFCGWSGFHREQRLPLVDLYSNWPHLGATTVNNLMLRKMFLSLPGLGWAGAASADWAINMPRGITELSQETFDLHMMVFWWCVAIGVVVFGVMIYSLLKHRKSKGVEAAQFSHSTTAEVAWTIIPVLILVAMAVPFLAARTLYLGLRGRLDRHRPACRYSQKSISE